MRTLTVEQINLDWLKGAYLDELKNAMRSGPDVLNAVNALLQTKEGKKIAWEMMNDPDYVPLSKRTPDPEEAAQIAADEAEAARQAAVDDEAARQANSLAETAADPQTAEVAQVAPVEEKKKYTVDYQVTDEDNGRPIGRATHFEAFGTEVEALRVFVEKLKNAHINAVRYAERVKQNRFKQSASAFEATDKTAAATAAQAESDRLAAEAANEKDPAKMKVAVEKAAAAQRNAEDARQAQVEHGRTIAIGWMQDHKDDFLPCDASSDIMQKYMEANKLPLTYDNLTKTFLAVKHQLPPVPTGQQVAATDVTTSAVTVDNSQSTAAAAAAAPAASITLPAAAAATPETQTPAAAAPPAAATAQASTPAAPNQATAARKPAANGSIQPGSLRAQRPGAAATPQVDPAQARAQLLREIGKMDPVIYRRKLATDKSFREKLIANGIPVVGHRS